MKSISKTILRRYFFWALLSLVFGCQGRGCLSFFGPELNWSLMANGLPRDGIWKSTPVFADVNGDGLVDLGALPRLGNGAHVWVGKGRGDWRDSSVGLSAGMSCGGGVAFSDMNK